jgi:cytochrome c oxidase subunit 4
MSGHVAPKSMYYSVFAALMVGTALTVLVAFYDLGPLNNVLMLGIAMTKATLVILYFMHVRWATRLTWVVAASGFVWLLILFGITMSDYLTRGWVEGLNAERSARLPAIGVRDSRTLIVRATPERLAWIATWIAENDKDR